MKATTGEIRSPARSSTALSILSSLALIGGSPAVLAAPAASLEESRIFIEYNSTDNDLGFHVFLDGEDWNSLSIFNPEGELVFVTNGHGPYDELGLTELFFEGAEPSLFDFPLADLLARFPEGVYEFEGTLTDGSTIAGSGRLSHAVPAGPSVFVENAGASRRIRWTRVDSVAIDPAGGVFPQRPINVVGYQVIVGSFQVTLPATATSVVIPPEFFASLKRGSHGFEVLAIDVSDNQTISSGEFTK
jgi:hypothetical protein